ncbi:hypothetical protein CsSME_00051442 [Camellia sinensis var. sinensis]
MNGSLSFSIGSQDNSGNISTYEDRTSRFFPSAPRVPQMPGVVPGDTGFMDKSEDSFRELSNSSHQRFNILCSGDKDGSRFSIFGIFPIGKVGFGKRSLSFGSHLLWGAFRRTKQQSNIWTSCDYWKN